MESLPSLRLLQHPPNLIQEVRKAFGLDAASMRQSIDILQDWVHKQGHFLKKDFDRDFLERTIIISKGSTEKAKKVLEKRFVYKTVMPQYFDDFLVKEDCSALGDTQIVVLPKMTHENNRVILLKIRGDKFSAEYCTHTIRYGVMISEYIINYGYQEGCVLIFDLLDADLSALLPCLYPVEIHNALKVFLEGYSLRARQIHVLSKSRLVDLVVSIFKKMLSAKLANRIQVHESYDAFHEYMSLDVLPKDYGGKECSLRELQDDWIEEFSSVTFRDVLRTMCKTGVDKDSWRKIDGADDMDLAGSFRTLSVD